MQLVTAAIRTHVREAASFAEGVCDVLDILHKLAASRLLTSQEQALQELIYQAYVAARLAETEAEAQEDGC